MANLYRVDSPITREQRNNLNATFSDIQKQVGNVVIRASEAKDEAESVQTQLNNIVVQGDSSVEAAQARVDADGVSFPTLKNRLDNEQIDFNNKIKLSQVNVVDYGADPTGALDSTENIQNAMNEGFNIYFPEGNYKVSATLFINSNNNLYGEGIGRSVIKWDVNSSNQQNMFERDFGNVDAGINYSFKNLTFDGSLLERGLTNKQINGILNLSSLKYISIDSCEFKNCIGAAVTGANTTDISIKNSLFEDIGEHAIYFSTNSKNIEIYGNEIKSFAELGGLRNFGSTVIKLRGANSIIENVRVSNNKFCTPVKAYSETEPYYAIFMDGSTRHRNITFENNIFNYKKENKNHRSIYASVTTFLDNVNIYSNIFYGSGLFNSVNDAAIQFYPNENSNVNIYDNYFENFNVTVSSMSNTNFYKNTVRNCGVISCINSVISNNDLELTKGANGIYTRQSDIIYNKIKRDSSIANNVGILIFDTTTDKKFIGNNFENVTYAIDGSFKTLTGNIVRDNRYINVTNELYRFDTLTNILQYPFGASAYRPNSNLSRGYQYFDVTLNKPIYWNGTNWVDANGVTV